MIFDVIIVGGGHAGVEAASVCSNLKKNTILITNNINEIGKISCNPSIGGVGKSQLIRELEIFGGVMPKAADRSCTFSKILNISKGYSVRSTRIQVDKYKYIFNVNKILKKKKKLKIIQSNVNDVILKNSKIKGVILNDGTYIYSKCVILTTGTFLNNNIYIGNRIYKNSNNSFFNKLNKILPGTGKFKTGTPPRIDQRSINFNNLKKQKSEINPFSFFTKINKKKFFDCWVTKTTKKTRKLVLKNLKFSAMYSGMINSKGPRYCPSIEDKYVRFPNNKIHNIFLEKESKYTNEIYPNGFSTSFNFFYQSKIIKTIKGLKNSFIIKPGYAIEYNYFDPINLKKNLESKYIKNLFLAGQINGTTGYEEAASQGLIAGINACKNLDKKKYFILKKKKSYIGLLINDITKNSINEPYRMFTSRSENRMYIREDNVFERLLNVSFNNNLISKKKYCVLNKLKKYFLNFLNKLKKKKIIFKKKKISIFNLIKKFNFNLLNFKKIIKIKFKRKIFIDYVNAKIKSECYKSRNKKEIKIIKKNINIKIPKNFNFKIIKGLSNEFLEKIKNIKINKLNDIYNINLITPTNIFIIKRFFLKKI
ncbi:tRNA uridine-5-carboxymethylaminomethyl(34) synthesis enzyme MnmG [Candidatus Vidania fulgoroideorum]